MTGMKNYKNKDNQFYWQKLIKDLVLIFKDDDDSPLTKDEIIEITNFIKTQLILTELKDQDFPFRDNT
tara:strand:+ start:4288 stop:4491 length:204 start_codon:yes stop_codon:yes gene_type:complete